MTPKSCHYFSLAFSATGNNWQMIGMSSTTLDTSDHALLDGPDAAKAPEAPLIVQVSREFGVSPVRQLKESLALRYGAHKLRSSDYYAFRLFDPAMPMAEKRQFVGATGGRIMNTAMTPPKITPTRAFVGNKLLYTQLLDKLGIPSTETQALVSNYRNVGQLPVLRDASGVEAFLRDSARYPLFGKPQVGSLSKGSVRIEACEGDTLRLANGQTMPVTDFANEVMSRYSGGFLMQTALDPHPQMRAISGDAIGCVRIVTVNEGPGPKAVYSVWKLPAPKAMSDNFWQSGSLLSLVDLANGEVLTCKRGAGLKAEQLTHHPTSGEAIVGARLPFWDETVKIAEDAHAVFPELGVCGFDIAVTPSGPQIIECNDSPAHVLYQYAADRGIWNDDFAPIWGRVEAHQNKQLAKMNAALKQKKKGR